MPRVEPGKRYTKAQLKDLIDKATADELQMQGYVLQFDVLSQTYSVVPWEKATGNSETWGGGAQYLAPAPKIEKRTPQERVESLQKKIQPDMLRENSIPGIPEHEVQRLVGETWKAGKPLTAEQVRSTAATLLQDAENKHNAKLDKQVTRHED